MVTGWRFRWIVKNNEQRRLIILLISVNNFNLEFVKAGNRMSSLKVGKYYIDFTQILGKGSTGNVYKGTSIVILGTNLETNETLAIKAIEMSKVTG